MKNYSEAVFRGGVMLTLMIMMMLIQPDSAKIDAFEKSFILLGILSIFASIIMLAIHDVDGDSK